MSKKLKRPNRMRMVVCVVEERHDITHEPYRLRVLPPKDKVDLTEHNDFVVMLGDAKSFERFGGDQTFQVGT